MLPKTEPASAEPASAPAPAPAPDATAPAPSPLPDQSVPAPIPAPRSTPENEHRYDIDVMRLVASCAVILGHVSATFLTAVDREESNGRSAYWIGHIGDAINQFAVPMFFAMAGWAVLMGAPPRNSSRMWQRIRRNGVPLFVWTGAYLVWTWLRDRNDKPMTDLSVDALFGTVQPAYHLWFLYAYIPIIMALAFITLIRVGQRPWSLGIALVAIAGLPQALPTIGEVTGWQPPPVTWSFGTYSVVYAAAGALLFSLPGGLSPRYRKLMVPLFLLSAVGVLWYDTQIHYPIANAHPFTAVMTGALLLGVSRIRVPERWRPNLGKLAAAAMGAYMVHVFLVEEIVMRIVTEDVGPVDGSLLLIAMVLMTCVLSYGASLLWGRLGLRRFLG
ncbi:acyltransferase [Streptomyces sp. NBC_01803]|uniref:acyltransferase n=1 Tax=Streptomyces sp. NBC_01803 TaxID=2975946 RepID=UPI002DDA2641|nr:acyltransferase [Streptomyces sp. NBC_01803]WSA45195.1 acyltransferase [Streptomyces sp. NBC_01803]